MKKYMALMLALVALLFAGCAAAEEFEGSWVQIDEAFQVKIPAEWMQWELDQSMIDSGVVYVAATEDGECFIQVAAVAMEAAVTMDALQANLVEDYLDAEVLEINGMETVCFTDEEENMMSVWLQDAAVPCIYVVQFYPAMESDYTDLVAAVAASISPVQ